MAEKKPGRRIPWLFLAVTVLAVAAGGAYLRRPAPPLEVEVVEVSRGTVEERVPSASAGEVQAARRVTVRAETPGTVASLKKRAGERVEAGELVVSFASDELAARVTQAKANVDAANVAVRAAELREGTAARALERSKKLRAGEAIADAELERADTEHQAAQHAVSQAKAALEQARAAARLAEVSRDRAVVRAPFAGVLQDVYAELGVQVAPGAPLFDLIDDTSLRISVPIDEADASRVFVGQRVLLHTGAHREAPILGRVSFIPPALGRAGGPLPEGAALAARDRALHVQVVPETESGRLRIGAAVNAELLVSAREDVFYVPTHVVIGRGRTRAVWKLEDGRARKVSFEPGLTSWDRTEVVSGLSAGDRVVASLNVKGLAEGARVAAKVVPGAEPRAEGSP